MQHGTRRSPSTCWMPACILITCDYGVQPPWVVFRRTVCSLCGSHRIIARVGLSTSAAVARAHTQVAIVAAPSAEWNPTSAPAHGTTITRGRGGVEQTAGICARARRSIAPRSASSCCCGILQRYLRRPRFRCYGAGVTRSYTHVTTCGSRHLVRERGARGIWAEDGRTGGWLV
ncbi:ADL359Cp [Eremothecium gossypii ATCC 10895]|uniref:ADL359Cp n=1 Tax=Eremothecium gossypii (strain ATCC 10895 / CBS 109.51 / FGSC 9923 / NRRL Y-1056) TaxID=284811 RepID=Q75BC6_EREGS|nr:ADL359Cp [Eremothecium gossypii ATCC 10895]AAS51560.1 ADL359Cp [Eremothecium gossypii ATCC 10895]